MESSFCLDAAIWNSQEPFNLLSSFPSTLYEKCYKITQYYVMKSMPTDLELSDL